MLITYYGDDFTGSTDSLEALAKGGLRVALFFEPPTVEQLHTDARFANLQAVGLAGISRSLSPVQMETELRPKLAGLKALGAPLCHYKTCSTFDSSPSVGSIGRAIDIGAELFAAPFVPIVVGAPALKRYMLFGNLFATVGPETFRLDRHPTMSQHPITPMDEGDMRRHLARQTDKSIALMDILHMAGDQATVDANFNRLLQTQPGIIFFDILEEHHLATAGRLIWQHRGTAPLYVVGSSGVEYALTAYWRQSGLVSAPEPFVSPGQVEQLVVMSGSASPVTAGQIRWAIEQGYTAIRLDTVRLIDPELAEGESGRAIQQALQALGHGCSVILYTALGPDDPALAATSGRVEALGLSSAHTGRWLAERQGQIVRSILRRSGLRRVCVAGGDTSSYAAQQLGIVALEVLMPTVPGSPICRAIANDVQFDGLEIVLKGGQVGGDNYFEVVRTGNKRQ